MMDTTVDPRPLHIRFPELFTFVVEFNYPCDKHGDCLDNGCYHIPPTGTEIIGKCASLAEAQAKFWLFKNSMHLEGCYGFYVRPAFDWELSHEDGRENCQCSDCDWFNYRNDNNLVPSLSEETRSTLRRLSGELACFSFRGHDFEELYIGRKSHNLQHAVKFAKKFTHRASRRLNHSIERDSLMSA